MHFVNTYEVSKCIHVAKPTKFEKTKNTDIPGNENYNIILSLSRTFKTVECGTNFEANTKCSTLRSKNVNQITENPMYVLYLYFDIKTKTPDCLSPKSDKKK